jgi:hypothetical protein
MNYIVQKSDNTVVWINPDSNKLTGENAWSLFNPDFHKIVFAVHYNPNIGDVFKAEIQDGEAMEFTPKKVWDKKTLKPRTLYNWEDEIDEAKETDKEPLTETIEDEKVYKRFQKFENGKWIVDTVKEKEASIPKRITPAQARLALDAINKLDDVETLMQDPTTPKPARILWEYATYFDRKNQVLIDLGTAIGLTETQLDQLFVEGAKINV